MNGYSDEPAISQDTANAAIDHRLKGSLRLPVVLRPGVTVPLVMSAGLITFLLTFANAGQVFAEIREAVVANAALICLLSLIYLIAKGCQWALFLRCVGIRPAWRDLVMAFAGGELSINVPLGIYLENYLLKGAIQADLGQSSVATTWMLVTEITCCLSVLFILDIPGWLWLRPSLIVFALALIIAGILLFRTPLAKRLAYRFQQYPPLHRVATAAERFLDGGQRLFTWRAFAIGLPITTVYLGAQAIALYAIGRALHLRMLSPHVAIAAYAFSVLVVLVLPVIPHLGAVEATGLGVLLTFGIPRDGAVAAFLTLRLLGSGWVMVIAGLTLAVLHQEVRAAIRSLSQASSVPGE